MLGIGALRLGSELIRIRDLPSFERRSTEEYEERFHSRRDTHGDC